MALMKMSGSQRAKLQRHLHVRCLERGLTVTDIPRTVSALAGETLTKGLAWRWLINDYANARGVDMSNVIVMRGVSLKREAVPTPPKAPAAANAPKHKSKRKQQVYDEAKAFYSSEKWRAVRFIALKRSKGECCLCGRSNRAHGVILHVDHIKPKSRFPKLALDLNNLQVLCEDCNLGKSNRDTTDWRARG